MEAYHRCNLVVTGREVFGPLLVYRVKKPVALSAQATLHARILCAIAERRLVKLIGKFPV